MINDVVGEDGSSMDVENEQAERKLHRCPQKAKMKAPWM
jgi:hypothetical protein